MSGGSGEAGKDDLQKRVDQCVEQINLAMADIYRGLKPGDGPVAMFALGAHVAAMCAAEVGVPGVEVLDYFLKGFNKLADMGNTPRLISYRIPDADAPTN